MDGTSGVSGSGYNFNAVYEDPSSQNVQLDDFLNLMVAQLQNQDFMDPVDDTQFLSQMATFATMQQMQELASYSKYNYTASMVGKEVTVAKYDIGGGVQQDKGVIERISFVDEEYLIYVNGNAYGLHQIMEVSAGTSSSEDTGPQSQDMSLFISNVTEGAVYVDWMPPQSEATTETELLYSVYYSTNENMDTLEDVKANGYLYGEADRRNLRSEGILGLLPGETYYVNIVVKDTEGNENIYKKATATTYV